MISQTLIKGSCPVCSLEGDILGALYQYKTGKGIWIFFFECAYDHIWEEREMESGGKLISKQALTPAELKSKFL